jgi:tetraacyldisaccharide 4'-kinase
LALSPATLQKIQAAWQQRGFLHYLLRFLSSIYAFLFRVHRALYQLGFFKTQTLNCTVIVVGNVVAGGAGKTPTVISLVQHLTHTGWKVGIISRGYGRNMSDKKSSIIEVNPLLTASIIGDEPLLIKNKCKVPVFVGPKRTAVAQQLLLEYPDTQIIISDDGLQHSALARDVEIIVFDDRGIGNGRLLPAGFLREKWPRSQPKAKSNGHTSSASKQLATLVLHTGQSPAFEGFTAQRRLQSYATNGLGEQKPLSDFVSSRNVALAAIAKPPAFFEMLNQQGLTLSLQLPLPDHFDFHEWSPALDWQDAEIFCTEKDAVKLWPQYPKIWSVGLDFAPSPEFFIAIDLLLKNRSISPIAQEALK